PTTAPGSPSPTSPGSASRTCSSPRPAPRRSDLRAVPEPVDLEMVENPSEIRPERDARACEDDTGPLVPKLAFALLLAWDAADAGVGGVTTRIGWLPGSPGGSSAGWGKIPADEFQAMRAVGAGKGCPARDLPNGTRAGLVGTSGIRVGAARKASLDYVVTNGGTITNAVSSHAWPGDAAVNVSMV